jgi:acyl-[acyl carrier protein]--UDP-N-acetylglucosamine O-acyltransferase
LIRAVWRFALDHWAIHRDPVAWARSQGVRVGERCRLLGIDRGTFGSEPWLVRLGDHVEITGGVRFITHDGGVWTFREEHPDIDVLAPIVIGNNVFVGVNTILMPGIEIGDNVVIGAGSVVTADIPPDTVAAGTPARPVRTRAEYWERTQPRAEHIRSWPREKKRRHLLERFRSALEGPKS